MALSGENDCNLTSGGNKKQSWGEMGLLGGTGDWEVLRGAGCALGDAGRPGFTPWVLAASLGAVFRDFFWDVGLHQHAAPSSHGRALPSASPFSAGARFALTKQLWCLCHNI